MKAVLPVAGAGTRLRPLTHTVPKVLVHVAGKPILGHILDALLPLGINEVVLVLGQQFGDKIVEYVESNYNIKVTTTIQTERKGNGHAIYLTKDLVGHEPCLIVFSDTLFEADLRCVLESGKTSIGVKQVADPRAYGVVETSGGKVTALVEKPENPKTDLAIVGVYYIKNSALMYRCLEEVMVKGIQTKGEFQLTSALDLMVNHGEDITVFPVNEWYDCGSVENLLESNRLLLSGHGDVGNTENAVCDDQVIIVPPVAIGKDVVISNSVIGPYVSIADGVTIKDSIIRNGIINNGAHVESMLLSDSLIGENAVVTGKFHKLHIGDSSSITDVS